MSAPEEATDQYGSTILIIRSTHLKDFQALIKWINEKGYSRLGVLKLRLHAEDRNDERCVDQVLSMMREKFKETYDVKRSKKKVYSYSPSSQTLFKASLNHHIYEFRDGGCSAEERKNFVKEAGDASSYKEEANCCTGCLGSTGLKGLREHFFEAIERSSDCLDVVRARMEELQRPYNSSKNVTSIIYGAGIPVDPESPVQICKDFTMTNLDDIVNQQEEKFDGISFPYIYSGSMHSLFPWHIEDVGLYSINYVMKGAKKVWFGISSSHFGFVDLICQSLRISNCHSSCRVLLADHKVLVADPQYFKDQYGVPYTMTVQEPGDFIITFPYALHAGFNMGNNLAVAANFADVGWIELGLYAPLCECKPDLLEVYLDGTSLLFPPSHPREVRRLLSVITNMEEASGQSSSSEVSKPPKRLKCSTGSIKHRTLFCPACNQSFKENKIGRLTKHIQVHHANEAENLLRIVNTKYPPWKPKMSKGVNCEVCGSFLRGDESNLKAHLQRQHPDVQIQSADEDDL